MSELLVSLVLCFIIHVLQAGFDMEEFDEADEQNEEDLMLLGDSFAQMTDLK